MSIRHALIVLALTICATLSAGAQQPPARDAAAADAARQEAENQAQQEKEDAEEARRRAAEDARRRAEERVNTIIPVDIELVISRYQGDNRVSSLPYAFTVNAVYADPRAQHRSSLRMGGEIPIAMVSSPVDADGKPLSVGGGPVHYRHIGTSIDSSARPLDDGRFEVLIQIEDTAVAPNAAGTGSPPSGPPVLRTFQSSNTIVLRDGQTRQFTAASDRITGEVVRVDVTLRVAK